MGGAKGYDTKYRDVGCPLVLLGLVIALFGFKIGYIWAYLVTFGLSWGALTTYFDWLFGYDNFFMHGLACGIAAFPLCMVIPWWIVLIRTIICMVGMGLWSKFWGNDVIEELGRGAFFIV
jgi:hypothetical protein